MQYEENPFVMTAFLDLVALLGQVFFTLAELPERRALVVVYARAYHNMKAQPEANFARIAHFLYDYEKPLKRLPDELRNASPRVGQALCSFCMDWIKSREVAVLRKDGTLSLSTSPAQMSLPSQEPFMYLLGQSARMYNWVLFGFVLCPDELALSEALPMVRLALASAHAAPLSRELSYAPHEDFDEAFDKHKNKTFKAQLKKEKKDLIKEALAAAVATRHRERRVYIRQELVNLYGLLRDQPGLLAPKIQLVLSALHVAREELHWYFRHLDTPPPKAAGVKHTREPDPRLPELLYHVDALVQLVRAHAPLVRQYYVSYLTTSDYTRAAELAPELQTKVPTAAPHIRAILEACRGAHEGADLRGLRLNWLRAEVAISAGGVPLPPLSAALKKFALIARHSRYVDQLEELLQEAASLRQLWYWRDSLVQAFDKCLESAALQPQYALAFVRVLAQCPDNGGVYTPEERELIGPECVNIAKGCLDKLAHRVCTLLSEVARTYVLFEAQLHVEHAAYPWLMRMKDFKPDKTQPAPVPPGSESEFKQRAVFEPLRQTENMLHQLLSAVNEVVSVHVYDHLLTPREFVRDGLAGCLRDFMHKLPVLGAGGNSGQADGAMEPDVQRPSVVERYLHVYCSYLKSLENYLDLPVADVIREVWVGGVYHKSLSGQLLDWTTDGPLEGAPGLARPFCAWYAELVARRVVFSKEREVFFSPNRKGFYSKPGAPFRAERVADITELRALCNLVGPYGVKLLDRELLRFVHANVAGLKEALMNNRAVLDELAKSFLKEHAFADALKKLRLPDVETFLTRAVQIGNALSFRALLHEALRLCTEDRIPYMFSVVAAAFAQYPRNTFSSTDCLAVDCLAKEIGLDVTSADHALKAYVQRGMGAGGSDSAVWNLLPIMFASSLLVSKQWAEAEFRPLTEVRGTSPLLFHPI